MVVRVHHGPPFLHRQGCRVSHSNNIIIHQSKPVQKDTVGCEPRVCQVCCVDEVYVWRCLLIYPHSQLLRILCQRTTNRWQPKIPLKHHTMVLLFIFEFILKAVLLVLGLLAWHGLHWAAVAFVVVLCVLGLFDLLMAFVMWSADRDIIKGM